MTILDSESARNKAKMSVGQSTLSLSDSLFYALPSIGTSWLWAPTAILQGIYAKYYGVSLATLASIVLVVRIFDVITDPMIGYCSDRYQRRSGTRKPFIVAGVLLLIVSSYFLYVPYGVDTMNIVAEGFEQSAISTIYLIFWFFLFYLAFTLFEIPHYAWGGDIANSGLDKSRAYSFRAALAYLGLVLFYSVPLLPFFESKEITPETLRISVIAAGLVLLPLLYVCITYTPSHSLVVPFVPEKRGSKAVVEKKTIMESNARLFHSIVKNKPLILFFISFLFYGLGTGLWYGVIFLYVDSYLNMGEQFAPMFLFAFVVGILVTPIWYKLSVLFGKKHVLMLATTLVASSYIYSGLLLPGETRVEHLMLLKVLNTFGHVCFAAIAPAMMSETIDYSVWKYKEQNAGVFFSIFAFISKANIAIGMALGLAIIGWFGYDATASSQGIDATRGLMLTMVWLPFGLALVVILALALSPINARRHRIIRRRLDSLAIRANRQMSLSVQTEETDSKQSQSAVQAVVASVHVPNSG